MKNLIWLLLFAFFLIACDSNQEDSSVPEPPAKILEIKGADISFLPEVRQSGLVFTNVQGQQQDMLQTLKEAGVNTIRLRLWKNPATPTSGLTAVKNLAAEAKNQGLKVMITVHYSDTWADPGNQTMPTAWQNLSFEQLKSEIYAYTKDLVLQIKPDYVQVGNELNNGFLFPNGSISNPAQFKALLKEGCKGVRDAGLASKIVLHYAGYNGANSFFSQLSDVDYDYIGISYYPLWHGKNLTELQNALNVISNTQNKKIFIAETSYPFTMGWNDMTNNVIGLSSQILDDYPATPDGQKNYLNKIKSIIQQVPNGAGFCYWGSEWVSYKGSAATDGSSWENQAFWDFQNKSLPVLDVYKN